MIKDFINDSSLKILGPKGNIYTKRIRKFLDKLDKKKIQGAYNIEELSQELMNEMPIRTKLGGCCIKPYSNAECNKMIMLMNIYVLMVYVKTNVISFITVCIIMISSMK